MTSKYATGCTNIWHNAKDEQPSQTTAMTKATEAANAGEFKLTGTRREEDSMIDLSTNYLGLKLRTPLVASASPLSHDLDSIRRLEDAGASAVVLYSLFEEQIRQENQNLEHHLSSWQRKVSPNR